MAFELGQIEVRTGAAREQLLRVVEEVEREVEDAARNRRAVDPHVFFRQMPAARPHEQHRRLLVKLVGLAFRRREVDPAPDRVAQVDVALDIVVPPGRVGVLEVGHEDAGARIERVDDHLAVDRPGDLDAAVDDVGRHRRARPVAFADRVRLGEEVGQLAGIELGLPLRAAREQLHAPVAERALQFGGEGDGLGGQDLRVLGSDAARDLDTGTERRRAHRRVLAVFLIRGPRRGIERSRQM